MPPWMSIAVRRVVLLGFAILDLSCHNNMEQKVQPNEPYWHKPIVDRIVHSDRLWVDRILNKAIESHKSGELGDLLKDLSHLHKSLLDARLADEGLDCETLLLVHPDIIEANMTKLASDYHVNINVIRYIPTDQKDGYVRAVMTIVETSTDQSKSNRPLSKGSDLRGQ
jgi:hypothetical protein